MSAIFFALLLPLQAADIFVNHETGDDANDGLHAVVEGDGRGPLRTILAALQKAGPGDTVFLAPTETPYRESIALTVHPGWRHPGGEAGNPLVIDGQGATISGAQECDPDGWEQWRDGIYRRADLGHARALMVNGRRLHAVHPTEALHPGDWRYFTGYEHVYFHPEDGTDMNLRLLLADGTTREIKESEWQATNTRGVRRLIKVPEVEAIEVSGARIEPTPIPERMQPGDFTAHEGFIYYYLPNGKSFQDLEIEAVVRANGVAISGDTSHVVIRNVHATKVYNDGFNIHGSGKDIRFENIKATFCFDEGYSAHGDVEAEIHGGIFLHNASGVTNVHRAVTRARDLIIAFSGGIGYSGMYSTVEELENIILIENGMDLSAGFNSPEGRMTARNIVLLDSHGKGLIDLRQGTCRLENLTAIGLGAANFYGEGTLAVQNAMISGEGIWHFRTDQPERRLVDWRNALLSSGFRMTWGAKHPFQENDLFEWLEQQDSGVTRLTENISVADLLEAKEIPSVLTTTGASPELLQKAIEFYQEHAADKDTQ